MHLEIKYQIDGVSPVIKTITSQTAAVWDDRA